MTKLFKQLGSWAAKKLSLKTVNNHSTASKVAFTLAEVLITLAIIGVVAALTIPALSSKTNEKGLNASDSVFQRRLGEALKVMNLQGTLAGHQTTQDFVNELGKHIKIMKTCPSTELSNCFVSEFQVGEETIKVSDLKKSKNLYKTEDYKTQTMGVVFGNGVRALIAYNPKATQDQFDNSNTTSPVKLTTTGTGKNTLVSLGTDSLSILYNLQERKDNNVYTSGNTGNIRGINISIDTGCLGDKKAIGFCISEVANSSTFAKDHVIDCTASSTDPYKTEFCNGNGNFSADYWATAKKYCNDQNSQLISRIQLTKLADYLYGASGTGEFSTTADTDKFGGGLLQTDKALAISSLFTPDFWAWSSFIGNGNNAYTRYFASSNSYDKYYEGNRGGNDLLAICVDY